MFTGYLIIYNVFQISVTSDIRFYGLLKTIGTTGKQIRRMIRRQAYILSIFGIPLGWVVGFLVGVRLTPVIMEQTSYTDTFVSFNPLIFVGAALFSLITVRISCRKPGKMAARVSPVEAVRYTDASVSKKRARHTGKRGGASLPRMAWANLGRSRGKTNVTVLSLALAVVLLQMTYTFATGFDMDKYLADKSAVDFVVGDASYFQTGAGFSSTDEAVPDNIIEEINAQGGITDSGRIYGQVTNVQEFVTEDWYRQNWGQWNTAETLNQMVADRERDANGLLADRVSLYGMEDFPLSRLTVLDGDLSALTDPNANAVAAVYTTDDYGDPEKQSHWAKVGDTVHLRYVEELEYYYQDTGEVIPADEVDAAFAGERAIGSRAKTYRDKEYTVAAAVVIPSSLDYRYYGADQFVLGAQQFMQDTGTSSVMTYVFDTEDTATDAMEAFLADYTEHVQPLFDYESKATYQAEFEGFRSMFLTLGGALSAIIGLIGVLNFLNAVLTGILTRKHEFAVLQAIGMTGQQLKRMLMLEGLYYALARARPEFAAQRGVRAAHREWLQPDFLVLLVSVHHFADRAGAAPLCGPGIAHPAGAVSFHGRGEHRRAHPHDRLIAGTKYGILNLTTRGLPRTGQPFLKWKEGKANAAFIACRGRSTAGAGRSARAGGRRPRSDRVRFGAAGPQGAGKTGRFGDFGRRPARWEWAGTVSGNSAIQPCARDLFDRQRHRSRRSRRIPRRWGRLYRQAFSGGRAARPGGRHAAPRGRGGGAGPRWVPAGLCPRRIFQRRAADHPVGSRAAAAARAGVRAWTHRPAGNAHQPRLDRWHGICGRKCPVGHRAPSAQKAGRGVYPHGLRRRIPVG